jgi:hypothetical protein
MSAETKIQHSQCQVDIQYLKVTVLKFKFERIRKAAILGSILQRRTKRKSESRGEGTG